MESRAILTAVALVGIVCAPIDQLAAQDNKRLSETLSTGEQADFVKEVSQGCVENQLTAPENKGVSADTITAFCRCTAERMVTRFSAAEIDRIVESITPELQAVVDQIEKACVPKAK